MLIRWAAAVLIALTPTFTAADPVLHVAPDVESGVYESGKTVTWTVQVKNGTEPGAGKISWILRPGGAGEAGKGEAELADGKAQVTGTRATPGTLLAEIHYRPAGAAKDIVANGGAVFDPDKIQGQIAKPAGKTELPALLQVQWAGVYPLQRDWVIGHAKNGWLSMNIEAHDLPIDEKPEFYKEKSEKELKDYPGQGSDDREKCYFLKMFLSCYRAAEYLTQRPDWGKKALVVHGGSQGGYQSIVTAGFHPAVTAFAANVPAGCDHTGKRVNRAPGWPNWPSRTWQGKDAAKLESTGRYFDAMNFATRIHCPGLIGLGLVDPVCPPEGVFATLNQMKGPKKVIIMPRADHGGDHKAYYAVYGAFLEEAKKGPAK